MTYINPKDSILQAPTDDNSYKVVLAYSGGLDTSFCILYLTHLGYDVVSVSVDTGGFSQEASQKRFTVSSIKRIMDLNLNSDSFNPDEATLKFILFSVSSFSEFILYEPKK